MNMENDLMFKRAKLFFERKIPVHVSMKSKKFANGEIIEVKADFFIVLDRKLGEFPVFFLEVYDIEPLYLGDTDPDAPIFTEAVELDETLTGIEKEKFKLRGEGGNKNE